MPKGGVPKMSLDGAGYHITSNGYPRFHNLGKFKGEYVHRHEAVKMLGRALKKDEEVHHRNGNKKDFSFANLQVLGSREHGWTSARQAFWMRTLDIKAEQEFHAVIDELEKDGVKITGIGANA